MPKFSIIIPVKSINDYIRETIPHIQKLSYKNWELIILPNELVNKSEINQWKDLRIKFIHSGPVGPAKKRDLGAKKARGEILVFLDDDSYPKTDFLNIAESYFNKFSNNSKNIINIINRKNINIKKNIKKEDVIVALGGPALTPPSDNFWQRVSGAVFLSKFSGGVPERYIPIGKPRFVDDWPTVNFIVKRKEFLEVGGFNSPYWPGEDTKFCLDLIQKTGKKILYIPEMIVWHHRRAGLFAHLKQIGGYGLHRGYFAKRYPETSFKLIYFIPSAFLIFTIFTITFISLQILMPNILNNFILLHFFSPYILNKLIFTLYNFLIFGWSVYFLNLFLALKDFCKFESAKVAVVALGYTFITHLWYGARFIQGLLTIKLISKLR